MTRMLRGLVALMSVAAMLSSATPLRSQDAGWANVANDKACGALRGSLMIATPDGAKFGLIVTGVKVGDQPLREVRADGKPLLLRFAQSGDMAYADLDAAALGALAAASAITLPWGDRALDAPATGLTAALNKASTCGAALQTKRVADAERKDKAERRRAQSRAFFSALGADSPDAPRSTMPQAGMVCMKKREWTSGFNKNCVYDCLGSEAVQTVGMAELCPLTLSR